MNIHFILQGKGGVGKSYIAALIAQYCVDRGQILAIDTDPVNATFSGYSGLNVQRAEIMDDGDINPRRFDSLMESLFSADCDDIIIDNGASSFIPLVSYLRSNSVIELLKEFGHMPYLHSVITGGQAMQDTLSGFEKLIEDFGGDGTAIIVWLNEFWGEIMDRGIPFNRMPVFKQNVEKIKSVITIPDLKHETFGEDISQMLKARQTFDEAIENANYSFMARQRLRKVKEHIYGLMEEVL